MKTNLFKLLLLLIIINSTNVAAQSDQKDKAAINRIDNYLSESVANGFSGAMLVARGGEILLNKGYGLADKENNVPITPKTIFDIGSVSKQFTATAILKLEEQGKLKVEDPLSKFFGDLPEDKKNITIHQLLIHSAGVIRGIGKNDFDQIPREDYFKQLFATELLHEPGAKHKYSNGGYSILARIIELVSGQSYESYLNEYLFKPAGMKHTGYLIPNWKELAAAKGYSSNIMNIGTMINRYQTDGQISWVVMGNGGINSTQDDMFKWYQALLSNKILSQSSIKKLTTPHILEYEGETSYYAYGWVIFKTPRGTNMVAHDGSNATFLYDFRWLPKEEVVILYATNAFTGEIGGMAWRVDKMFFDDTYIPKKVEVDFISELMEFAQNYDGNQDGLGANLKLVFGSKIDKPYYLDRLGGLYFSNNMMDKALFFAKLNTELFPKDSNAWDSLGYVYYSNGYNKKALKAFKRLLLLDSDNIYAKDMVKKLESGE